MNIFQRASEIKESANKLFQSGNFQGAVEEYSLGIKLLEEDIQRHIHNECRYFSKTSPSHKLLTVFLCNRSLCSFKLGHHEDSLQDAEYVFLLDPMNLKAYYRKGQALMELKRLDDARDLYQVAMDRYPENTVFKRLAKILDQKTGDEPSYALIEKYVNRHGTIKGCANKLTYSMFDLHELLGEGNYSLVYRAVFRHTDEEFALKVVEKRKVEHVSKRNPNIYNELKNEKRILYRLNHPNIIKLIHTFQDESRLYYTLEYVPGNELWTQLRFGNTSTISLPWSKAKFYAAQLVNAMDYLHSLGVIHRDIKPENLLCYPIPDTQGRLEHLKLIDFGTAYTMDDESSSTSNFVGTPEYMSPETIAAKEKPTFASDIWALGVVLFQLSSGIIPFKGSTAYLTFLRTKEIIFDFPDQFDNTLRDLLDKIFKKNPGERISYDGNYSSIKKHEYFNDVDFMQLLREPIVPVPSLFELSVDAFFKVLVSTGTDKTKLRPGFSATIETAERYCEQGLIPKWAVKDGLFSKRNTSPWLHCFLLAELSQRCLLDNLPVRRLLFDSILEARFHRVFKHSYLGLSENGQGSRECSFNFVHIGSLENCSPDVMEKSVAIINSFKPTPKLVVISGNLGDKNSTVKALSGLKEEIAIVCCPDGSSDYERHFGDRYFSFYINMVMFIVIDSFLLKEMEEMKKAAHGENKIAENGIDLVAAENQNRWLEKEILKGKYTARQVILLSHHAWSTKLDKADLGHKTLASEKTESWLENLADAGCQIILSGGKPVFQKSSYLSENQKQGRIELVNSSSLWSTSDRVSSISMIDIQSNALWLKIYCPVQLNPQAVYQIGEYAKKTDHETRFSDISSDESDV